MGIECLFSLSHHWSEHEQLVPVHIQSLLERTQAASACSHSVRQFAPEHFSHWSELWQLVPLHFGQYGSEHGHL